ncbi:unnamed protein product [Choristocarpus tenellus]
MGDIGKCTEVALGSLELSPFNECDYRFYPTPKPYSPCDGSLARNPTIEEIYPNLSLRWTEHEDADKSKSGTQLLFLVRHGETMMNASGRLQGRGVDVSLNEVGEGQAEALGIFLRNVPFGAVISSSLKRAHETATMVMKQNKATIAASSCPNLLADSMIAQVGGDVEVEGKVSVMQDPGVDELSWGELEGEDQNEQPWSGLLEDLKEGWFNGDLDRSAKRGESPNEVMSRATASVAKVVSKGHRMNLIVSHGRTLRVLMLALCGRNLSEMRHMGVIPNTGLYVVEANASVTPPTYRLISTAWGREGRDQ